SRHDRESDDREKVDRKNETETRTLQRINQLLPTTTARCGNTRGMIGRDRFRQRKIKQNRISEGEPAGKQKRHVDSPAAEDAADRRTEHESQSERRANQSHPFRAIFFRGDISDVSLRG